MKKKATILLIGIAMIVSVMPMAGLVSAPPPGPGHIWLNCEDLDGDPCERAHGGGWKAGGWVFYGPYGPNSLFSFYLTVENRARYDLEDLRIVKAIHNWTSADDLVYVDIEGETEYLGDFDTTEYNPHAWQFGGKHHVFVKGSDAIWDIHHHAPNVLPARTLVKLLVTVQLGPDPSDLFEVHFDAFDFLTGDHSPNGHDVTLVSWAIRPPGEEGPECSITYNYLTDIFEGDEVAFDATAFDPDGGDIVAYFWDFDVDFDWDGDNITDNDIQAVGPSASFKWYDNGIFRVQLTVIDDEGQTGVCYSGPDVEILNLDPVIEEAQGFIAAELCLRVAGSKWSNVMMTLYEDYEGPDENPVAALEVERWPGPPDENPTYPPNSACVPVNLDVTGQIVLTAVIEYDPYPDEGDLIEGDQPNNGNDPFDNAGNPVWLILKYEDGNETRCHHTFNTQQSMIRDSDHWNHVEPWIVEISGGAIVGAPITFVGTATDEGTDDLTFVWDWGDGSGITAVTHYYDPTRVPQDDPLPSPYEPYFGGTVPPLSVTDTQSHTYAAPGTYTVTLTVTDDDGGSTSTTLTVTVDGGSYCT
jgi:hypothetical protein